MDIPAQEEAGDIDETNYPRDQGHPEEPSLGLLYAKIHGNQLWAFRPKSRPF